MIEPPRVGCWSIVRHRAATRLWPVTCSRSCAPAALRSGTGSRFSARSRLAGCADIARSFLVAAPAFLLTYFGTFVALNLLIYPGPMLPLRSMTPLADLFDLRMGSLAMRVPFFLTLACALWEAQPRFAFDCWSARDPDLRNKPGDAPRMFAAGERLRDPAGFVRFLVIAGLVNALIAAVLLCRLPASRARALGPLLMRASAYVAIAALADTLGAWWYWRRASASLGSRLPLSFRLFALICAVGWMWVTAVILLADQDAPAATLVAALAAGLLALGLRSALPSFDDAPSFSEERELFAETPCAVPR